MKAPRRSATAPRILPSLCVKTLSAGRRSSGSRARLPTNHHSGSKKSRAPSVPASQKDFAMDRSIDLLIKNARVVRPAKTSVDRLDIAIAGGKIVELAPEIRAERAKNIFDAKALLAFPGCVDAHMHVGIYQPLALDAVTETKAAAMGGVTSSLNY